MFWISAFAITVLVLVVFSRENIVWWKINSISQQPNTVTSRSVVNVTNHFKKPVVIGGKLIVGPGRTEHYILSGVVGIEDVQIYTTDPPNERLQSLTLNSSDIHIGGITSRWTEIDGTFPGGVNTSQGVPWVRIHNMTAQQLRLNDTLFVEPFGALQYTGEKISGIRLGTIFRDNNGLFPNFVYSKPCTDIYYGTQTEKQVEEWGGLQRTLDGFDPNEKGEPVHLLEDGYY